QPLLELREKFEGSVSQDLAAEAVDVLFCEAAVSQRRRALRCRNGGSTLGSAVARPEYYHLGIDILPVVIRYATRQGNQRGLSNLRFAVIGGRELLAEHVPAGSVAEIHIYHPQPYSEPSQIDRRLITP